MKNAEHYYSLAERMLFKPLSHRYVIHVSPDWNGCIVLTEHYDYMLSPAEVHISWER